MEFPRSPIETPRLLLRPFEKRDLEAVMAYHVLPDVQRYLDWKGRDRGECVVAIESMSRQRRFNRPGDVVSLAIVRGCDSRVIGQVSLRWTDATASQAEMRFAINPAFRGQGYCTEAVRAVLDVAFGQLGFHRVFARCGAKNRGSAQMLKGLGMRLEAHYREHALFQGEWDEELHFAILDREWQRGGKVKELPRHLVA
jgi:RimJ/RimL family protein N-acetyltransferase